MATAESDLGRASLTGHRPDEVLEVVRARALSGSRADGHRVALVVEGGAMRGVYTAASLLALHALGLADLFDDVYGTSAGAINAAHFVSGLGDFKVDTYYRLLADGRFLNPYRLHKIVDIDFLVDEVLAKLRPMEIGRIMVSRTRLWVCVGDYVTGTTKVFLAQRDDHPLLQLLKAAIAMPVVYNKRIQLGDVQGFDAGFFSPFPLHEALADGHSHILVLLTRPEAYTSAHSRWWESALFNACFARQNDAVRQLFKHSAESCNRLRDLAHGRASLPSENASTCIATISPVGFDVSRTSQKVDVLRSELIRTARGTLQLFGHPQAQLDKWIGDGRV